MGGQVATALLAIAAGAVAAAAVRSTAGAVRTRGLWWVGALGAAGAAATVAVTGAPVPVGSAIAGAGLSAAAVVDAVEGRVPTGVAFGTAVVACGSLVAHALLSGDLGGAVRAAALTGLLVAGCAALWVAGAMGFGDVRLATGTATGMLGGATAPGGRRGRPGRGRPGRGAPPVRGSHRPAGSRGGREPPSRAVRAPLAVAWLVAVVVATVRPGRPPGRAGPQGARVPTIASRSASRRRTFSSRTPISRSAPP